jgi:transposase
MKKSSTKAMRFVGLDVHAQTIAAAVAETDGEVRWLGTALNREDSIAKLVKKLNAGGAWEACYEAGPTGYALYWELARQGVVCTVIAPTLAPTKAGDRVKTDRRDAERLARSFRAGDLTAVCVPDPAQEALRDLVRAREAAKQDQLRARHRLGKFLLRQGIRLPEGMRVWPQKRLEWIKSNVKFEEQAQQWVLVDYVNEVEHCGQRITRLESLIDEAVEKAPETMKTIVAALQSLRGIAKISAVTIVSEVGQFSRFATARQLMGCSGAVPSEHSSGERTQRGHISRTGNGHLRRIIVEAAWTQRFSPVLSKHLKTRQTDIDPEIIEIASKAMHRLHSRYQKLLAKGKTKQQVVTAAGRELLGFVWAIGVTAERESAA